jgi:hypothetical protein
MQPPPYGSVPVYGGLRPLGVGEILDQAIQVYRKNFRALVVMTAVAVIPVGIITILIHLSTRSSSSTTGPTFGGIQFSSGRADGHDAGVHLAGALIVIVLSLLSGRLAIGACTRGVSDAYLGSAPADARSSLGVALRSLGSLIWLEVLAVPAVIIGFLFCIAPGVWLWTSWLVATPALLVEGARGRHALARSFELVRPRFWPTLGLALLAVLLTSMLTSAFSILLVGVIFATHSADSTAFIITSGIVGMLSSLLTTPLVAAAYVILYYDLRVRREGLDIQLVLSQLDSAATASPPAGAAPPWGAAPPAWPAPPPPWGAPPPPPAAPPPPWPPPDPPR